VKGIDNMELVQGLLLDQEKQQYQAPPVLVLPMRGSFCAAIPQTQPFLWARNKPPNSRRTANTAAGVIGCRVRNPVL